MYYRYVIKELRHRSNRTLVNVFVIAVGIALFVSISAVSAAYKDAARQPFKNIGADLIVQRAAKQQSQPNNGTKSMRGIRLPFSNQLFDAQDLLALQQIEGIDATAHALLLWEFAENGLPKTQLIHLSKSIYRILFPESELLQTPFPQRQNSLTLA